MDVNKIIGTGIGIAVMFVVIAAVFPVGLESWYGISVAEQGYGTYNATTGVFDADSKCSDPGPDTKTQTFTKLMPFFGMLTVGLLLIGVAKDAV